MLIDPGKLGLDLHIKILDVTLNLIADHKCSGVGAGHQEGLTGIDLRAGPWQLESSHSLPSPWNVPSLFPEAAPRIHP